jgi:hypothetical protein
MNIFKTLIDFFKKIFKKEDRDSITVNDAVVEERFSFEKNSDGCGFILLNDASIRLNGIRHFAFDGSDHSFEMVCVFKKGFKSDGTSSPSFAQKFLPDVKIGDDVYNAASFIHDALYVRKGCVKDVNLSREECDDILRGTWRCSGVGRLVAGVADVGIQLFAGSEEHWGDDSLGCGPFFEITMTFE